MDGVILALVLFFIGFLTGHSTVGTLLCKPIRRYRLALVIVNFFVQLGFLTLLLFSTMSCVTPTFRVIWPVLVCVSTAVGCVLGGLVAWGGQAS